MCHLENNTLPESYKCDWFRLEETEPNYANNKREMQRQCHITHHI